MPLALRTSLELEGCPREEGKPRPSLARVAGIIATMPVAIFGHFGHFRPFLEAKASQEDAFSLMDIFAH